MLYNIKTFLILCIGILLSYNSSFAQGKKVDCDKAVTQLDMNICAKQGYEKKEKELKIVLDKLIKIIKEQQDNYDNENQLSGKNLLTFFKDSQKQWEEYRNSAAGFNGAIYQGGSIRPLIYFGAMSAITKERIKELKDLIEEFSM